ncbi:hypothetical protein MRB53_021788 [Persea americana]|uniref:Uncharacterized protein n=1 Tax=Persea americana TaxID=3435 RepID=A0ACC2L4P4_PERAE|nr:hypothetical protein MRB53_021788 [Persea americana]
MLCRWSSDWGSRGGDREAQLQVKLEAEQEKEEKGEAACGRASRWLCWEKIGRTECMEMGDCGLSAGKENGR